jgi:hypothetical protein
MTINKLIEKYISERSYYLSNKYNETLLRSDFLDPMFELLGWDIKNHLGKSTYEREVILEEPLKANVSEHSKKPDYTFRLYSERKYFLEAKKPSVAIEINNETAKQVRRYGFTAKLKISVISNFEYLIIYDTSYIVDESDTFQKALIKKYHYTEYISKFEEIKNLLGRESVYNGQFENEWQEIETKIHHYSIDDIFLKQINEWRKILGEEIFKFVPSLKEDQLNDVVQSYINRVIFLRVCEDRNLEEYQTLLKLANDNDFEALVKKFKQADKRYNSGLFDQLLKDKILESVSSVFWTIISQLYYPESPYSFSVFSSDILGRIYELFLSEKLSIINGEVELEKKPENIDRDIVTTPTFIIKDILIKTVVEKCKGKTDIEILEFKFADISCGSGAFLLELFQLLNDLLIDYYLREDSTSLIQTNINTYKLEFTTKKQLLLNCIYGIDKDYNAVEATKFGLLLKLLEGEDSNSTIKSKPILPCLSNNIYFGNSLISPDQIIDTNNQIAINPFDFSNLRFDVIIGNPPYMKSEDMVNLTPLELPIYKSNYLSAYRQFDKYFLFIEKGIELLTNDGLLGYIVPSKFIKVASGEKLRKLLMNNGYLSKIISFGANQIFDDKSTYTCLLLLSKKDNKTFQYSEIKNLDTWKLRIYNESDYSSKYTKDFIDKEWVLMTSELEIVYSKIIKESICLEDIVGSDNIFNGIQTSANKIYVHKILSFDQYYYYFNYKDKIWKIETELTRPYFQTDRDERLYTYRPFKPNSFVIYPYKKVNDVIEFVQINDLRNNFPYAYNFLLEFKDDLIKRDIQPAPRTDDEWYRYGRHQSLDKCEVDSKIVVGILSKNDGYAIDFNKTVLSSGGNAGYGIISYDNEKEYSIYYLQAILNSKYVEWICSLLGTVFRGGYFSHGTQVLKKLPIRKIDFTNKSEKSFHDSIVTIQKNLIKICNDIDLNVSNNRVLSVLRSNFTREKQALEDQIRKLYDLDIADDLVPLINDLYEND